MTRRTAKLSLNSSYRPVFVTAMVSALAAGVLPGCTSSSGFSGRHANASTYKTQYTARDYAAQANKAGVKNPAFVDVAQTMAAKIQAQREAAFDSMNTMKGQFNSAFAAQNASFDAALAQKEAGQVMAQGVIDMFGAKLEEMRADADALRLQNVGAMQQRNGSAAVAMLDWQRQFDLMYAEADYLWSESKAQYEAMLVERQGILERGEAQLKQMEDVIRLAAEKSSQRYASTKAHVDASRTQANAQVNSLDRQITALKAQREARLTGLRQQIDSISTGAGMEVDALRKHAAALEQTTTEAAMSLSHGAADAAFEVNQAEAQRLMQSGQQIKRSSQAQAERTRSDASTHFAQAKSDFQEELEAIDRFVTHSSAEIDFRRSQAKQFDNNQTQSVINQCNALSDQVAVAARKRTSEAQRWWSMQQSEHVNQLAKADAMEHKGFADGDELIARGEAALRMAASYREDAYQAADADRQIAAARILGFASGAQALDVSSDAQLDHLNAAIEAFAKNSQAELEALAARREAAKVRGDAEVQRFQTQADSEVKANASAIDQMHAQIDAAEAMLFAELNKLGQAANSYQAIAKATHTQSIASAEAFKAMAESSMHEMLAASAAESKIGEAQVVFAQKMQQVAKMAGDVEASKQLVNSGSEFAFALADNARAKAEITARANAAEAAAKSQIAAANANDQALWSAFNQQLAQASVQNIDPDGQFGASPIDDAMWPTGAAAVAFRTLSSQALDRLHEQAMQFSAAAGGAFWSPINLNRGYSSFTAPIDPNSAYEFITWQIDPASAPASTLTNVPVKID